MPAELVFPKSGVNPLNNPAPSPPANEWCLQKNLFWSTSVFVPKNVIFGVEIWKNLGKLNIPRAPPNRAYFSLKKKMGEGGVIRVVYP